MTLDQVLEQGIAEHGIAQRLRHIFADRHIRIAGDEELLQGESRARNLDDAAQDVGRS